MSAFPGWLVNGHSQGFGGGGCMAKNNRLPRTWQSWRQTFDLILWTLISSLAPSEPLLCKFADGGQKKRQSQNKFSLNGRGWGRDGDNRLVSGDGNQSLTNKGHLLGASKMLNDKHPFHSVYQILTKALQIDFIAWCCRRVALYNSHGSVATRFSSSSSGLRSPLLMTTAPGRCRLGWVPVLHATVELPNLWFPLFPGWNDAHVWPQCSCYAKWVGWNHRSDYSVTVSENKLW